jgi:hypothetical protein
VEWVNYKENHHGLVSESKSIKLMGGDRLNWGGGGWGFSWEVYIVGKK